MTQKRDRTPAFPFERARVGDAMRSPIRACSPALPLRLAADIMASERIHCLVVIDEEGAGAWRVLSDLDLVAAIGEGLGERTAGEVAGGPAITVHPDDALIRAAQLMRENGRAHVIATDPESGRPLGVLSTLDLLRALAWGQPPAGPQGPAEMRTD